MGEAETEAGFAVAGGDLGDHVLEPAGDVGVDLFGGEGEELCVAFDLAALTFICESERLRARRAVASRSGQSAGSVAAGRAQAARRRS